MMKPKKVGTSRFDDAVGHFKARCRQAHLRVTPQRVAVYELLLASKEHPSAAMVLGRIRKRFADVSLDTVNRTLATIVELGLAKVIPGCGGAKRFDANLGRHQHFRCVRCRKIIDFEYPAFENMKLPREIREDFTVLSKTVYVQGICSKCL
jgi:Fur family peroxide stress response transcriptional regulator